MTLSRRSFLKFAGATAATAGVVVGAGSGYILGAFTTDYLRVPTGLFRSIYSLVVVPELNHTNMHEKPWPDEEPLEGRVIVNTPGPVEVGLPTEITVDYHAGPGGIQIGGAIRVAFEHAADWGRLQSGDPAAENFVTVSGPEGTFWELRTNYFLGVCTLVEATLKEGKVQEGERVTFLLGDGSGGSPGFKAPSMSEVKGAGLLRIFEDRTGEGSFYEVPDVPELEICPGQPYRLRLIARAWVEEEKPVVAVLQVKDRFGNVVSSYEGPYRISDPVTGETLHRGELKQGVSAVNNVPCPDPDREIFRLKAEAGELETLSNPIECLPNAGGQRVFFGSLHNHAILCDGLNTPEGTATYARDISNLDFFSLTGHVSWRDWEYEPVLLRSDLGSNAWEKTAGVMRDFNDPGSFVTLLGFEWTTTAYGDKNVYFLDDSVSYREFPVDQKGFYLELENERATVITHTMGAVEGMRGPRWDLTDTHYERVMEIASYHGIFEYGGNEYPIAPSAKSELGWLPASVVSRNYAEGVLNRGMRLGFVAGSDDHSGKPGAGVSGLLPHSLDGLTAVRGERLTRETIFEQLESRSTYATTGARILLDFSVNGHGMGREVSMSPNLNRQVKVNVHGEAPIRKVEIIREDPRSPVKSWNFDPPHLDTGLLEWTDPEPLNDSTWYYLRVTQEDGHMAWSSPVWVDPDTLES